MSVPVRRLTLGQLLGGALFSGGVLPAPLAAPSRDPAAASPRVPPRWEVGDLTCDYFDAQGISGIVLADPATNPHGRDDWDSVPDGSGCEG